ncbi:hypothetical protein SERLADRAFT_460801 [Serpula lacrymans var. lacrymans S7.9]|uniref:Uncharacterized protein n=1 Tax=Serpula lacrymans var. lacrymans (strain S7.9) TaxID=578457 RepID=F8NMM1_SERL9|nr:uncharacterized protein SERLADRAFT_460801 [Serpula lacrymans var. lacrymans S7.9]EGO27418.1 hypothetical protein SERLADRAFT_460801 [Serpula lacrymans var. lacrymans S7.9]
MSSMNEGRAEAGIELEETANVKSSRRTLERPSRAPAMKALGNGFKGWWSAMDTAHAPLWLTIITSQPFFPIPFLVTRRNWVN